jgi:hypothetical protein
MSDLRQSGKPRGSQILTWVCWLALVACLITQSITIHRLLSLLHSTEDTLVRGTQALHYVNGVLARCESDLITGRMV